MHSRLKSFAGAAAAFALCVSPTMAAAATSTAIQPINPLIAVSIYGTQASAQTVCTNATSAAAAAGAAAAAQAQPGCVLPAVDVPPPPQAAPPPQVSGLGFSPVLLGLLGIAALAALIASGNDNDDDDGVVPVSP